MNLSNTSLEPSHFPVMLDEVIKICSPEKGGIFVDCTFGGGGYSKEILKFPNTSVIAFDRDKKVEKNVNILKKKYSNRFSFFNEKFSNLNRVLENKKKVDALIFDLGLSTFQLQDMSRGFSFKSKDKIDMNMGLAPFSAEDVLNNLDEKNLKAIIKIFGDEKEAFKIVKNIINLRKTKRISKVIELVELIENSKKKNFKKKINVCTKTFQALRIFVNKETSELIEGIIKATKFVKPGGKIIIISFHSIEDKIVKYYFNNFSSDRSRSSRYFPEDKNNTIVLFKNKNNFLIPSAKEIRINPPSRSAKLRFAVRNDNNFIEPIDLKNKFRKYLNLEEIHV
jgi:16S rRNA (cytosine1402-N4)-methyltransferase